MSKIKAINGHIVLRPVEEEEQMYGNIALPDLGHQQQKIGEVLETSNLQSHNTDHIIDCPVKKGDLVFVPPMGATKVSVDEKEFWVIPFTMISAILIK
jgi:co-chaperonin GroES (HSP10)